MAGVRYWVAEGATIVSHRANRAFLETVVARRWTSAPDELERQRARLRFASVNGSLVLGGGELLVLPTDGVASEGAVAVFARTDRFLWASDFIQTLSQPTTYLSEVLAAVQRVGVTPATVAGQHPRSPRGSARRG